MMDESITRVGFLHIPGSMGTSIGSAVARSLNVRYFPIHRIANVGDMNSENPFTLQLPAGVNSLTRDVLLSYPFISGHLSVGQIQATYRTHIFTVITEPRQLLIKLFCHHATAGLSFSDWLTQRVNFQSDIIDTLANGVPIANNMHWLDMFAVSHREPSNPRWTYDFELVNTIVSPIDFIFFAKDPQFVVDSLTDNNVLPRRLVIEHLNQRDTTRQVNLGDLEAGFDALKHVTMNDYKFIDHLSSNALVDPQFETWDDAKTWQFLKEVAGI